MREGKKEREERVRRYRGGKEGGRRKGEERRGGR